LKTVGSSRIRYLSQPAPVSMGDDWFNLANLAHFWIRRRFEVFCRVASAEIEGASDLAEIGCGHGLVQRQIEDRFHKQVMGFDLHEKALQRSVSRTSEICCYDIFQKNPELKNRFDAIILFDVLEHLNDEDAFLQAILFHLAPGGTLLINVPAFQQLWSAYDEEAGHIRRYDIGGLTKVAERNGITIGAWTYWGFSMIPLLVLRKLWVRMRPREKVISSGWAAGGSLMNGLLLLLSRAEFVPQHCMGTSLLTVLKKPSENRPHAG
jgi:SAM-dependent methyltransferase